MTVVSLSSALERPGSESQRGPLIRSRLRIRRKNLNAQMVGFVRRWVSKGGIFWLGGGNDRASAKGRVRDLRDTDNMV